MKNIVSYIFVPPQHASQCTLLEKLIKIHWLLYDITVPSLDSGHHKNPNSVIVRESEKLLESTSSWFV